MSYLIIDLYTSESNHIKNILNGSIHYHLILFKLEKELDIMHKWYKKVTQKNVHYSPDSITTYCATAQVIAPLFELQFPHLRKEETWSNADLNCLLQF